MNCPTCNSVIQPDVQFCSNCGRTTVSLETQTKLVTPQQTHEYTQPLDPFVGEILDKKYQLIERLGSGGMGAVYRARRLHIGDEVAVKVLRPDLMVDEEAIERFRREARSAALISHANVVIIHDFSEAHGSSPAYIVMELVRGLSLRELLKREGRLSPERAVALMSEICAGVGVAHLQNVLHRDLKPDNVIVMPAAHEGDHESAKVVDFGLAKLRDGKAVSALTHSGAVIGTLCYMSPEQCSGSELDARTDVYSLGAMFFEMLTGMPPFRANSLPALISQHLHEPPPPFPANLQIPPAIASACYRALEKNRDLRQTNAVDFARELRTALHRHHDRSTHDSVKPKPNGATRRRSKHAMMWMILTGLLGLTLVSVGGLLALTYGVRFFNGSAPKVSSNPSKPSDVKARSSDLSNSGDESSDRSKDLTGTWTGTYGPMSQPARLIIKNHHGTSFDGFIEQGDIRVAINGTVNLSNRDITINESAVVRGSGWSLGHDEGQLSPDGKRMSGTGKDAIGGQFGISYSWVFTRE